MTSIKNIIHEPVQIYMKHRTRDLLQEEHRMAT